MRKFLSLLAFLVVLAAVVMGGVYVSTMPDDTKTNAPSVEQGVKIVKPLDLNGKWKSDKPKVTAVVQNGTIEVESITEDGGFVRWWYGTFDNPQDGKVGVTSKGIEDPDKFYLSSAETKDFVYDKEMLKFQISMMGVTRVVEMKRV